MKADPSFESWFDRLGPIALPTFSGIRVMMLPIILGDPESIPDIIAPYRHTLSDLFYLADPSSHGQVAYITIDERSLKPGETHRRAGAHVDGVWHGQAGGWGGGPGPWGGRGMLTVSSVAGCRAWRQTFHGAPGPEGECDHLMDQAGEPTILEAGEAYWLDGLCVHESIPMGRDTERQFVRLSMPSTAPWFEGYTVNPLGVMPAGPILPRREFMQEGQ